MKWQNCLKAMGKSFHPECFACAYCGKIFANSPFYLEDGLPYCEEDWNELFTTKCISCGFPIEAGDRWVEALNNNYHSQCFNCSLCKDNMEGKSFYAKGGRIFCKNHAVKHWVVQKESWRTKFLCESWKTILQEPRKRMKDFYELKTFQQNCILEYVLFSIIFVIIITNNKL